MKLLDFNPFGSVTDSLLFSWDELSDESLHQADENNPHKSKSLELRLVEHDSGINTNQYGMYSQPTDFLTPDALSDLMKKVCFPIELFNLTFINSIGFQGDEHSNREKRAKQ